MGRAHIFGTVLLGLALLCAAARAEETSVLLEEGVYEQDVAGDLDKAMAAYRKIIDNAEGERRYVAEAHFRLGKCLLAKGDRPGAAEQFRAVVERYGDQEKLAAAAESELAKLAPPVPRRLVLGPVRELTVNDDGAGADMFVDLDTGRLYTPPPGMDPRQADAMHRWVAENGIDAMADTNVSLHGLMGIEMAILPFASARWDSVTAQDIAGEDVLSKSQPGTMAPMPGKGDLPVTYLFKTREGGTGILQIVGFADNPHGVKIRYRMVQQAQSGEARTYFVPDVDSSRQALDLDRGELVQALGYGGSDPQTAMGALAATGADLFVDRGRVVLIEGARANLTVTQTEKGYEFHLLVAGRGNTLTTGEGNRFEVLDMSGRDGGVQITVRTQGSAPAGRHTYGPVVEQTGADRCLVDFDTGRVLEKSEADPGPGMAQIMKRAGEIGADALFFRQMSGRGDKGRWCMATFGMGRGSWPRPDAFDNLTPDDLMSMERRMAPGMSLVMVLRDPPDTMVFSTREGGQGILQTVGFTENPSGVRIRYKMVHEVSAGMPPVRATLQPMDTHHMALELATGQMVPLPNPQTPEEMLEFVAGGMRDLARGDLGFGYKDGRPGLVLLRGASAVPPLPLEGPFSLPTADLGGSLPKRIQVTTREGRAYEVTVLRVAGDRCELECVALPGAPAPSTGGELAGLRSRLAASQADVVAKDAAMKLAQDWMASLDADGADTGAQQRARTAVAKASAELEAARRKAEMLTQEIKRLERGRSQPAQAGAPPEG